MNWLRIAAAAGIPAAIALPIAGLFWRKRQLIVGNGVGALVLFFGFLIFGGSEYVDAMAYRKWCQAMDQPVRSAVPVIS